ncbi:MAG TPA: hypothetical protein VFH49_06320, partial [Aquabacterium sp.]|nr:hypothetical protein [Aquabacterium sp.]
MAWLIVVSCGLAAGAGMFLLSSIWIGVVFLLLCGVALHQALRVSPAKPHPAYSASVSPGYWQDWLAGWYWQTDAMHRLVVLKPDQDTAEHWLRAQKLTQDPQPLWSCWTGSVGAAPPEGVQAALAMLQTRLKAGLPID